MSNDQQPDTDSDDGEHAAVDVAEVQRAAETFAGGLVDAFGLVGTTTSSVDGNEIEVRIDAEGDGLGLLIGPGRPHAAGDPGPGPCRGPASPRGSRDAPADRCRRLSREAPCRPRALRHQRRRPREGVRHRSFARSDAVRRPQGHPRHAVGDRGRREPVGGRRPEPPDHCQPRLTLDTETDPRLDDTELVEALESSRRLGMLGSAPIADVVEHSSAFLAPLDRRVRHRRRPRQRRRSPRSRDRLDAPGPASRARGSSCDPDRPPATARPPSRRRRTGCGC